MNKDIQTWLKENWINKNPLSKLTKIDNELKNRLSKYIKRLQEHLDTWFNIYNSIFIKDEKYALCFTVDQKKLGKQFPRGIENVLQTVIINLEN